MMFILFAGYDQLRIVFYVIAIHISYYATRRRYYLKSFVLWACEFKPYSDHMRDVGICQIDFQGYHLAENE